MSAAFSEEENQTRASCSVALTSGQVCSRWFEQRDPFHRWTSVSLKPRKPHLSLSDSAKATPGLEAHKATSTKKETDSPVNTPPSTPSGPMMGHSSKIKQRKRKKSAAACGAEAQSSAIQPTHIREAIRRYSHKIGPLSPFSSAYRRNGMTFLAC